MKKTLAFILALALCFGITACAELSPAKETLPTHEITTQAPTQPPTAETNLCKTLSVPIMGRMTMFPTLPTQAKYREKSWYGLNVLTAEKKTSALMPSIRKN